MHHAVGFALGYAPLGAYLAPDVPVALSTDVDTTGLEANGTLYVEGDGTATVKANGGVILSSTTPLCTGFIVTTGTITFTPSATATGATSWYLWYFPIDDGAAIVTA